MCSKRRASFLSRVIDGIDVCTYTHTHTGLKNRRQRSFVIRQNRKRRPLTAAFIPNALPLTGSGGIIIICKTRTSNLLQTPIDCHFVRQTSHCQVRCAHRARVNRFGGARCSSNEMSTSGCTHASAGHGDHSFTSSDEPTGYPRYVGCCCLLFFRLLVRPIGKGSCARVEMLT